MSKKTPPKFIEGMSYKAWKNKITMWKIVTTVPKKEQAIVILLDSLEGNAKAEKAVSELTATDLNNDDGIDILFQKLDRVFESERIDEAYNVYSNFIRFQKLDEMSMNDYIIEYEHLYYKMTQYDMKLPDTVPTFKFKFRSVQIEISTIRSTG